MSILGYFLFASVVTRTQAEFIVVNILGGFIYSYAKIKVKAANNFERFHPLSERTCDHLFESWAAGTCRAEVITSVSMRSRQ